MACASLKRRLKLEPLHSPKSESSKRRRHVTTASGDTVTLDKGVALSPSLTKHQVSTHIRHELKRLNRHRQLNNSDVKNIDGLDIWKDRKPGSIDDKRTKHWKFDDSLEGYPTVYQNQDDKPIFTLQQAELICERMMKEREDHLQEMYGKALRVLMDEQYDIFVKFTHDQIQKGALTDNQSYLT